MKLLLKSRVWSYPAFRSEYSLTFTHEVIYLGLISQARLSQNRANETFSLVGGPVAGDGYIIRISAEPYKIIHAC